MFRQLACSGNSVSYIFRSISTKHAGVVQSEQGLFVRVNATRTASWTPLKCIFLYVSLLRSFLANRLLGRFSLRQVATGAMLCS